MAALTVQEITSEIEEAFREAAEHESKPCDCCTPTRPDGLSHWQPLYGEAFYAIDRYRPGEAIGLSPNLKHIVTDETDDSIDELVERMVAASIVVVRETMTRMAAEYLAGKVALV